mmetsp:Transcript_14398/g.24536  ORF Transcript_14398/g.24536 Transcript_14398/m.24536 type:complete len:165 (-) Transcript_14398:538-1032(-)
MSDIHVLIDVFRMWLLVRVYKKAYSDHPSASSRSKMLVFCLLLLQAKYKFVSIAHQFNDCFMMVFCLLSIHAFQHKWSWTSSVLMAVAINIKMSALLMLPGFLLVFTYRLGIVKALLSLALMAVLQVAIGLEFILVNPRAYFKMSYNFERRFEKVEQVNFQFLS